MRWEHAQWRKLYVREEGSFAMLPLYARALAGELLKFCDDEGRIFIGKRDPADAVARITRAETGERRLLKQHLPALIDDGYLVHEGEHLRIRNLERAQEKKRGNAPSADDARPETAAAFERETDLARTNNERVRNEFRTNSERATNEPTTNSERESNELGTRNDSSARNHSGRSLTCTRARSVLNREEESSTEEISTSSASAGAHEAQASHPEPIVRLAQEPSDRTADAPNHVPAPQSPTLPPSRASNGQPDAVAAPSESQPTGPDFLAMANALAERGNSFARKMVDRGALGGTFTAAQRRKIEEMYAEYREGQANAVRAAAIRADQAPPTPRSGGAGLSDIERQALENWQRRWSREHRGETYPTTERDAMAIRKLAERATSRARVLGGNVSPDDVLSHYFARYLGLDDRRLVAERYPLCFLESRLPAIGEYEPPKARPATTTPPPAQAARERAPLKVPDGIIEEISAPRASGDALRARRL